MYNHAHNYDMKLTSNTTMCHTKKLNVMLKHKLRKLHS